MTRPYQQRTRAAAQDDRRARMIQAVFAIGEAEGFEAVTLQSVADRAEVSLKTLVRHFGTKEELLRACMEVSTAREEGARQVPVGDVPAVAAVLAERYELIADRHVRRSHLEFMYPVMAEWLGRVRQSHMGWLGRAFAPWLPGDGAVRDHRLRQLFWATELRAWWALRHPLGCDRHEAEAVLRSNLEALVASWDNAGRST